MGKGGKSICSNCKISSSCSDFAENKKFQEQGFSINIVECESFKE